MKEKEDFHPFKRLFFHNIILDLKESIIFALVIKTMYNQMAKVGYIFRENNESFDTEREWMQQYGCVQIVEETVEHENAASDVETAYGKS